MIGVDLVRLWAIARKEWIQLRRDPRSMALAFLIPVLMLLFFGYAITWDVKHIELAVYDADGGTPAYDLVQAFEASGYFTVTHRLTSYDEGDRLLETGQVLAVMTIPPDFTRHLLAGEPAPVQLLLDGSDANTATIALGYADAIAARFSRQVLLAGRRVSAPVETQGRVWYNPELRSRNMIVPGLVAVIMSIIAAVLTALTIAREWERGTMEQLAATPVHRLEVVLGKLVPYLGIGLADVTVATLAGVLVFGVPLHGSVLLLAGMTLLFLIGALGLGMFISAAMKSQVLATQAAMIATYLPALLLSGFLFDTSSMPLVLRLVSHVVPARYYITVTRGIFLKDVGIGVLWPEGLAMIAFAVIGLGLAVVNFRKRIAR